MATKILINGDRLIFDGHADNRSDCEMITLLCNGLKDNPNFKTIEYRSGYAEFEKVGHTEELKFIGAPATITMKFDSNVVKVVGVGIGSGNSDIEWTTSGSTQRGVADDGTTYIFNVTLADGFIIDKVTLSDTDPQAGTGELVSISDTSFKILAGFSGISQTVTIRSKQAPTRVSVDLATAFPDKWAALSIGKHTLQIRAKNPGNYLDSDLSTAIEFYKTCSITVTATHCTAAASNPTAFPDVNGGDTILTFNKVTGYTLPETIVITGVAGLGTGYTWTVASDGQSAQLKILKALGDITVKVEGVVETYAITTNLTHATKESGPSTIAYGASATLVFAFPTGYEAPADVTVTGATKSWTAGTATLVLSNPTGPVTVNVVGVATTTTLDGGTYKWHDSINLGEWTQNLNFTSNGTSYTGMQYTGDGTAMTLQYRYGESEWVTVYNYNEDTSTGSWVNDNYKIVDLGTSAQTVTAIFKADFIANTTKLTQLAIPQNVTADGTNVSWDEVENATSYEVIEGGNNVLGTYTPPMSYQFELYLHRGGELFQGDSPSVAGTPEKVADIAFSAGTNTYTITKPYVRIVANSGIITTTKTGNIVAVNSTDSSDSGYVEYYYLTGDCTLSVDTCLTGDTLITLADRTQKRIDQLTVDDKILAYNPETMSLEADDITYTDADCNKTHTEFDIWKFSDGTEVKTVHRHRFYNVERQTMVYMDEWKIGEHAVNSKGEHIALVEHQTVKETIKHYTIFTKHQNYFANGLLSGNRYTKVMAID